MQLHGLNISDLEATIKQINGVVDCRIVASEDEIEERKLECGIPFWPHAFVKVDGDIEKLLQNWNNEYGIMAYGEEIYDTLVDFCELMGIKVILP